MLIGPSPTLTNWITYRPVVVTGMVTLAMPLEDEFTEPSTLPVGSITTRVYGTLTSASAATEKPSAFEGTITFCSSDWPRARGLVLVVVVPGPADAWALELPLVTQILSTYAGPVRLRSSNLCWVGWLEPTMLNVAAGMAKFGPCMEVPGEPEAGW